MIWLTLRQFRAAFLATLAALVVAGAAILVLGLTFRHSYDTLLVDCAPNCSSNADSQLADQYGPLFLLCSMFLLAVPGLLGIFWGAPLVAREFETGTHRLAWTQSVTRVHWLAVKLGIITVAALAVTGALSLLLSWASGPYDGLVGERFTAFTFGSRDVAPLGYALFAFVLGVTVGLTVRRTLPAMAITLAVFAVVQIAMPTLVRPHLMSPVTETLTFTPETMKHTDGIGIGENGTFHIFGYQIAGAWMLTKQSTVYDAAGNTVGRDIMQQCMKGNPEQDSECLAKKNLHFTVSYQPADRYWPFQWLELIPYLGLALLLAGFSTWRIRRGVG